MASSLPTSSGCDGRRQGENSASSVSFSTWIYFIMEEEGTRQRLSWGSRVKDWVQVLDQLLVLWWTLGSLPCQHISFLTYKQGAKQDLGREHMQVLWFMVGFKNLMRGSTLRGEGRTRDAVHSYLLYTVTWCFWGFSRKPPQSIPNHI
jgi:hypothetical protein